MTTNYEKATKTLNEVGGYYDAMTASGALAQAYATLALIDTLKGQTEVAAPKPKDDWVWVVEKSMPQTILPVYGGIGRKFDAYGAYRLVKVLRTKEAAEKFIEEASRWAGDGAKFQHRNVRID